MDNSEIDLLQVVKTIWAKKKQILFFTALIVIGCVLFSYINPKHYEVQKTALVLQSTDNIYKPQKIKTAEYYERLSVSQNLLNAVLEDLPKEFKFDNNITSLSHLRTMLRVESIFIRSNDVSASALKLIYVVHHTDPFSAEIIASSWLKTIERNFYQIEKDEILIKYDGKQKQLALSKDEVDEAKKNLANFKESYSIKNETIKLHSIQRSLNNAHIDLEYLEKQLDPGKILIAKSKEIRAYRKQKMIIEKEYLSTQEALKEYSKRDHLLHQNATLSTINSSELSDKKSSNKEFNPIHIKLQKEILTNEVHLKTLDSQKARLDLKILNLEAYLSKQSNIGEIINSAHKNTELIQIKDQIKLLKKKIGRYQAKASKMEREIAEKIITDRNLTRELTVSENLFDMNLKNFKELELLKAENISDLNFSLSNTEPAFFLGTPLKTIIFLSSGTGLILMILIVLIKENFNSINAKRLNSLKKANHQFAKESGENIAHSETRIIKDENTVFPSKTSEVMKQPKSDYSHALTNAGFTQDS
jgi:uncharacterized protein involved in exopolysaccharide biosynthesis